jgi:hypothetical protein
MPGFAALSSYPVTRSSPACAATGRAFAPGERFIATLVEREGSAELERVDYSMDAWDQGARPSAPLRLFGFWRAVAHDKKDTKPAILSDEELLDLFEQLTEAAEALDTRRAAFRYLLALLLVRRRQLRQVGQKMEKQGAAEPITVPDPGLTDEVLAHAMEQLTQIMPDAGKAAP